MRWFNVDLRGRCKGGAADLKKLSLGDHPEQLACYAIRNITDCYLREIGRPPKDRELELVWARAIKKENGPRSPFKRNPESEII